MKKILLMLFVLMIFTSSCTRWKVNELLAKKNFVIQAGNKNEEININFKKGETFNLTFKVSVSHGQFICSDNIQKKIIILDMSGSPKMVIGAKSGVEESVVPFIPFTFGVIGNTTSDKFGNIYVQNSIVLSNGLANADKTAPSHIIVFNDAGKLQYVIGQSDQGELPLYYIDSIFSDANNRLFVITRTLESCGVYRYADGKRNFSVLFDKNYFKEKGDQNEEYTGRIETIKVFKSGEKFLISVAYYSSTRFKYRKIMEYSVSENKLGRTIMESPDPKNELFSIMEDKYLILWDIYQNDVRFSIWNLEENIINNLRITMFEKGNFYEEVLIDDMGKFFTMSVKKDGIYIKAWE